jgi:hypothetical protein
MWVGFPAKLVSFCISRNTKRNKFRVSQNKLVVSRNFALKRNKQFRMFRYFLNETKQPVSHVSLYFHKIIPVLFVFPYVYIGFPLILLSILSNRIIHYILIHLKCYARKSFTRIFFFTVFANASPSLLT